MSNNNNSDNSDNNDCSPPPPTYDELKACQFSSWYTTFRNLHKIPSELLDDHDRDTKSDSNTNTNTNNNNNNNNNLLLKRRKKSYPYNNVTIRSIIIKPLPLNFIEYLQSDGIILPIGAEKVSSFLPDVVNNSNNDEYNCDWSSSSEGDMNIGNHEDNEDNESDASNEGNEGNELNDNLKNKNNQNQNQYHFPELNDKIQKALDTLGPSIPKLNWSCPKDVTWVNAETLKCSTVGDVYLLLKSSDFCMFDLTHALDGVQVSDGDINGDGGDDTGNTNGGDEDVKQNSFEYELILRKWSNLHASMEFRCFVSNHEIVAISQRNHTQHFPHLKKDYMTIRSHIVDFFNDTIQYTYSYNANVNNNDNENENVNNENSNNNKSIPVSNYTFDVYVDKSNRVWLIDFNVWAERTDSLLFKWDELMQMAADVHVTSIDKDTNKNTDMNESSNANTSNVEEKEEDINLDNIHVETNEKEHDDDDDDDDDKIITIENIKPEIRVVRNANEVLYDPLSSYRAPIDTVDLASDNVGSHTFQDFMAMCQRPSAMSDSDSDSDSSDDES